jgi:hypothetical protein
MIKSFNKMRMIKAMKSIKCSSISPSISMLRQKSRGRRESRMREFHASSKVRNLQNLRQKMVSKTHRLIRRRAREPRVSKESQPKIFQTSTRKTRARSKMKDTRILMKKSQKVAPMKKLTKIISLITD